MAAEKVKKIISAILEKPEYILDTPRNTVTRRAARELLTSAENNCRAFSEFSEELIQVTRKAFPAKLPKRSPQEKALSSFQNLRFGELESVWEKFYLEFGKELTVDAMMKQYTNEKIFNDMYVSHFAAPTTSSKALSTHSAPSADEDNIVRYIAGYVPLKLLRKYEKQGSAKAAMFVEVLSQMKVNGREADFTAYATEWIQEVNRGGLFEVSDSAYELFRMLELLIRDGVPNLVLSKEVMLERVSSSDDIQFQWSLLSVDIEDDDLAQELLEDISTTWLSIRSHALTRRWMETYKQTKRKSTKKSKGLRKELKKGEKEERKEGNKSSDNDEVVERAIDNEGEDWAMVEDIWGCPDQNRGK